MHALKNSAVARMVAAAQAALHTQKEEESARSNDLNGSRRLHLTDGDHGGRRRAACSRRGWA